MPNEVITRAIDRVAGGADLSAEEAAAVLHEVMGGRASEAQSAAFLIALRTKGETISELTGLARTMRELAVKVEVGENGLVDTAGTGGGAPTFNVSTTAALVAAAAGARLAKHGNRSATSRCGSADVLESLGVRIDLGPEAVAACVRELGFGFMFAPRFHLAMRHVVPVRKELGVRTIFNLLGPLTNPAGASRQVIGVSDPSYLATIAAALGELGTERALVVSSADGLDELSASGPTHVVELKAGTIDSYELTPEEAGLEPVASGAVGAGSPAQNAEVVRNVFSGAEGAERAMTVLNAGAALYVGGQSETIADGVRLAAGAIDSGAATRLLEQLVERSQELGAAQ
jgi:anthranilate phosphoribosyltransferase